MKRCPRLVYSCFSMVMFLLGTNASAADLALDQDPTTWVTLDILKKFPVSQYHYVFPGYGLSDIFPMLIANAIIDQKPSPVAYVPLSQFKDEKRYAQPKELWLNEWEELNARFEEFVPKTDKTYLVVDVYNQGRTLRNLARNLSSLGEGAYRKFEILGVHSLQSTYDYIFYKQEEVLTEGKTKVFQRLRTPWAFFNKRKMQSPTERFSRSAPLTCSVNCSRMDMGSFIQRMKHVLLHDKSNMRPRLNEAMKGRR